MASSYHVDLLRGRCQELPEVRSKVVRVFISSTFSGEYLYKPYSLEFRFPLLIDTLIERDSLIETVFPQLKDYCRKKYGLEFQVREKLHTFVDELFIIFTEVFGYAMGNHK